MNAMNRILIVDDHAEMHEPLAAYLGRYGFLVTTVKNGQQMRTALLDEQFDLILLDVVLPGEDGLALCRFVREHVGIPVILLSALGEASDRIAGLEVGADDYLVKPFDPRELVARIKNVIRRTQPMLFFPTTVARTCYKFSNWVMDIEKREVRHQQGGQPLDLSNTEFRLLQVLLENPNTVLNRERLLQLTCRQDSEVFDRSIDSQISRLRRKFSDDAKNPRLLRTIWGNGYILTTDVSRSTMS